VVAALEEEAVVQEDVVAALEVVVAALEEVAAALEVVVTLRCLAASLLLESLLYPHPPSHTTKKYHTSKPHTHQPTSLRAILRRHSAAGLAQQLAPLSVDIELPAVSLRPMATSMARQMAHLAHSAVAIKLPATPHRPLAVSVPCALVFVLLRRIQIFGDFIHFLAPDRHNRSL